MDTLKGIIMQQEAANRDRLRELEEIVKGIPIERLREICDEERKRNDNGKMSAVSEDNGHA